MNAQEFAEAIDRAQFIMFLEDELGWPAAVVWNGGATFRVFTFDGDAEEVDVFTRYLDEDESGKTIPGYRPTPKDAQIAILEWVEDRQDEDQPW